MGDKKRKIRHKPGKGKAAKKARAASENGLDDLANSPHTFIFKRGRVGKNIMQLITDMRRVMEPYTASKLKARKKNTLKDYVTVAGMFNVSHLVMFSKTDRGVYLKMGCVPHGPTLHFKVDSYSLVHDVVSASRRPHMEAKQFVHHPILIMNNFGGDALKHKLISSMFQNMFPAINVDKAKLNNYKRCVILSYNQHDDTIDFRHYNIHVVPAGLSKSIKKLIKPKIPDMSNYQDISDYVLRAGYMSESEGEQDGPANEVILPQFVSGRGNIPSNKSAVRLTEIGPRMTFSLIKIQEELQEGSILYHRFKSAQELAEQNERIKNNVHKKKKKRKMKKKPKTEPEAKKSKRDYEEDDDGKKSDDDDDDEDSDDDDDDEEDDDEMMIDNNDDAGSDDDDDAE